MLLPGEFEMALRHVERGRLLLEEQRARIARLEASGPVPETAIQLLTQLELTLAGFEHHVRILLMEMEQERAAQS